MNEKFKEYIIRTQTDIGKVDFNILVLTTGSWPLQNQPSDFLVPLELERCIKAFQDYYNSEHHGRKLNWLQHQIKGQVKTLYLKKRYEIQVTNYQLGVLLLFNKQERATLEDFLKATNLKDPELSRTLSSLVSSKLLLVNGDTTLGSTFFGNEVFTVNAEFSSKRQKFKITSPLQSETHEENMETHQNIEEDRKLYLQAAIVRVMKARKQLSHTNVIQEVIEQSRGRFQPSIPMIKKCIEQLIEKEYLRRVDGEANHYAYIA